MDFSWFFFFVQVTGNGAKTTTFEISVTLREDIAQYCRMSHCVVHDGKFNCNDAVKYSISLV